ncbi:MAG: hypothetical protein AAGF82_20435, partial [Pseudomonadota bacterium]
MSSAATAQPNKTSAPGKDRLEQAERRGLRLAIICRTIAVGAAFLWVGGTWAFTGFYPNPWIFVGLGAFT